MPHLRPAVHRTILVVDIAKFGDLTRTNEHQLAMRAGLYRALERAFKIAGIPWHDCLREDLADGVYILGPSVIHKARFVEDLPGVLAAELRTHNQTHPPEARIRLRMALHAGEIRFDEHGKVSPASIFAFRLVEAPALRSALDSAETDLAVIVSPWFYDEVVRHSPRAHVEEFRQVSVSVKEITTQAWISVPTPVAHVRPAAHPGGPLPGQLFDAAVKIMETIPCLRTEYGRTQVIENFRPAVAGAIPYHPRTRPHIMSILRTCVDYDRGLAELLEIMTKIEGADSVPLQRLVDLLGDVAA